MAAPQGTRSLQLAAIRARQENAATHHAIRVASDGSLRARSREQALRSRFYVSAVEVVHDAHSARLRLHAIGRPGAMVAAPTGTRPTSRKNRVSYAHSATLEEWYLNGPLGLEQGFELASPPTESRADDPLVLEVALEGLRPRLMGDGDVVTLEDARGSAVMRYAGLYAEDASGHLLEAKLAVRGQTIRLVIDDEDARYPLTIDPILETSKLSPSVTGIGDWFGFAMSASGDTAVVGSFRHDGNGDNSGVAQVFVRNGPFWTQEAILLPSDLAAFDWFGHGVGISGDTIVVGSPYDDDNGSGTGSGYIFEKPAGGWTGTVFESAKLLPVNGHGLVGFRVGISGDTVILGASEANFQGGNAGAAYIFEKPAGGWTGTVIESARLLPDDLGEGDNFGYSVAISGDNVVVGAPYHDTPSDNIGAAYAFDKPAAGWSGTITSGAKLTPTGFPAGDRLGFSVSISGTTALVGCLRGGTSSPRPVYIFERPMAGWSGTLSQTADLVTSDSVLAEFGHSVTISDGVALVGVRSDSTLLLGAGSAYVFREPVGGWTGTISETAKLYASDAAQSDSFGNTTAVSENTFFVAAIADDDFGDASGSVYTFKDAEVVGTPCISAEDCLSGYCVDDVCCEEATCPECEACNIQGNEGVCAPVATGTPCGAAGSGACDQPDTCDGTGTCAANPLPSGTACGDDTDTPCDAADTCDGAGTCGDNVQADGTTCADGTCMAGDCIPAPGTGGAGGEEPMGGTDDPAPEPTPEPTEDGGCGCMAPGERDDARWQLFGIALGLVLFRRRLRAR